MDITHTRKHRHDSIRRGRYTHILASATYAVAATTTAAHISASASADDAPATAAVITLNTLAAAQAVVATRTHITAPAAPATIAITVMEPKPQPQDVQGTTYTLRTIAAYHQALGLHDPNNTPLTSAAYKQQLESPRIQNQTTTKAAL